MLYGNVVERGNSANPKLSLVYMKNRSGVVIVGFVTTLLLRGRSCRAAGVVDVQVRGGALVADVLAARVVARERLRYGDLKVAAARDVYLRRLCCKIIGVAARAARADDIGIGACARESQLRPARALYGCRVACCRHLGMRTSGYYE